MTLTDTLCDTGRLVKVDTQEIDEAVQEWSQILGAEHVLREDAAITRYSRSTLPSSTRPQAILRPRTTEQVRQVVCVAARRSIPLYPISRGKNWGYGDACAVTDGQVIVDLSRMNRIVEVNTKLAYAVIEPGVTQGQLSRHLAENHYPLWLDVTGAGPDASVIGNTVERGFGHTPYGDRFLHSCDMQVVLADGRVLNTGFGAYENAKARHVHRWGMGPSLDGLFTQSNFGIVTRMTVWLIPAPEACQAFAFSVPNEEDLEKIVKVLRDLRLSDVIRSTVHIANDLRVLSSRQTYPWELTGGDTPLPDSIRKLLRSRAGIGAWNVMGALYGTKKCVAAARSEVRKQFRGLARVHFFDEKTIRRANRLADLLSPLGLGKRLRERVRVAQPVFDLLRGVPNAEHLRGVFWRSRTGTGGTKPDPSQAGIMWLAPVLPMTDEDCQALLRVIETQFARFGFEPLVTLTSCNPRALCCVASLHYDKTDAGERDRAGECYKATFDRLMEQGYVPYRVGIQSMHKLAKNSEGYWEVCQQIKDALDPSGILAPGRYQPGEARRPLNHDVTA